jgi:hypothetical protein
MSEQIASQSEESQQNESVQSAFEAFGLIEDDAPETPTTEQQAKEEAPAIEPKAEPRIIKVKHNKEEVDADVSDDKLPELVQRSLALDKERERKAELEKNLDRAAKLAGFKDHADYIANLDRLEKEAQQKQQDQFQNLRQQLREEAEDAGLDPDKLDAWLDNHPLLQEASKAIQERQVAEESRKQQTVQEQWESQWQALYDAYPDLVETSTAFAEGGMPEWYTPEMQSRIERGYDPKDAYELAHSTTLRERNKQIGKQQAIKEQRLGLRAQVETNAHADLEPEVPTGLASAFSLFGLPTKAAQKYVKK